MIVGILLWVGAVVAAAVVLALAGLGVLFLRMGPHTWFRR